MKQGKAKTWTLYFRAEHKQCHTTHNDAMLSIWCDAARNVTLYPKLSMMYSKKGVAVENPGKHSASRCAICVILPRAMKVIPVGNERKQQYTFFTLLNASYCPNFLHFFASFSVPP